MTDLNYSSLQERAIQAIVDWYGDAAAPQEFYLAGYAGTGKSTVVSEAQSRLRETYKIRDIPIGAYTGKAAYVLRQKGNDAQTIHSMIYTCAEVPCDCTTHLPHEKCHPPVLKFIINPVGRAAEADLIILDECSMIDHTMGNDLRSFGHKILVMGDPGQLPPINGEGSFTNRKPDFFLDEIHRQAADSPIIELATWARQGIMPPIGYSKGDVRVLPLTNANADAIHNPDTQVLCGLNRIRWAVTQIMRKEQGFGDVLPMPGEKILCCKNNKNNGLFNGGAGTLQELKIKGAAGDWRITGTIEGEAHKDLLTDPFLFRQHFDSGVSQRDFKRKFPNEFDWGYIWSVHKAQGTGWPHVTLIDNSPSFREDRWKHLYTGITRAEKGLTLLASP